MSKSMGKMSDFLFDPWRFDIDDLLEELDYIYNKNLTFTKETKMVALPAVYKTTDLPDTGGGNVHIPDGQYPAVIVSSEFKTTKDGQGQYLALKTVITSGQYANTEFTERLNLVNKNPQTMEIAYKTLARISEAVGMASTPSDSVQLHNKPFLLEVKTEAGKVKETDPSAKWPDKSVISKYHPLPGVGGGVGGGAPAFAANAPAFAASQPVAFTAPVAANAPAVAPWAKG